MKKKFKKLHITQTKEYELTQSPFLNYILLINY